MAGTCARRPRGLLQRLAALWPRRDPRLDRPVAETRFVVLDTETTGLYAYAGDQVVAIAVLELEGLVPTGRHWSSLVNPGRPIPAEATAIHGITDEQVAGAPALDTVLPVVDAFLADAPLVGHHTAFDLRFINRARRRAGRPPLRNPVLDTMLLYLATSGRLGHYTLEEVAGACGVTIRHRHTALGDARAAADIFACLVPRLVDPQRPLRSLLAAQRQAGP